MDFLNENVWILIEFQFKFVPKSPTNNIPVLVQNSDNALAPTWQQGIIWPNDG